MMDTTQMDGPVQEATEATGQMVEQGASQNAGEPFDSTEIREGLRENVPPQMREAYDKLVAAGMKIMFDKSTHKFMKQQMAAEGDMPTKLADGISSLMVMMLKNSKGAFPQQLIIPAGIELMLHAADFAAQGGGERITADDMGAAIQQFVFKLFEAAGVKSDALIGSVGHIQKLQEQGQAGPQQGDPMAEQPGAPAAPPQGAGGLLSQPAGG